MQVQVHSVTRYPGAWRYRFVADLLLATGEVVALRSAWVLRADDARPFVMTATTNIEGGRKIEAVGLPPAWRAAILDAVLDLIDAGQFTTKVET